MNDFESNLHIYNPQYVESIRALQPQLTDEFLDTLVVAYKTLLVDQEYFGVPEFIKELFYYVGKQAPELE
jgi:hypothetical protein